MPSSRRPSGNAPSSQKTWRVQRKSADPAQALAFADSPVPKPKKGEILVRVQAAALNPVGYKALRVVPGFLIKGVQAVEHDFVGVVVDPNGSEFNVGDEVVCCNYLGTVLSTKWGALAQYTRTMASTTVLRPKNVTPTQCSGFPMAGLTAYQAIVEIAKVKAGQWVFVNGGSTAVGSFAIQIAKALGAKVAASASAKNERYVRDLGAEEFFDYTRAPLQEQLKAANEGMDPQYDVFFETVGGGDPTLYTESPAYLARKGVFVSVSFGPLLDPGTGGFGRFLWKVLLQPTWLGGTPRLWKLVGVEPSKERMSELIGFVAEGKVRPLVDSVFAYEDVLKAYERIMTGRATGKVVIRVDPAVE